MKLIADAMLGRLARWLRALGHDVLYDETLDDAALARTARGEGRLLLTRDRRLCADPRVRSAGFQRCPACGRVYWEGSHARRMRRWLEQVAAEV